MPEHRKMVIYRSKSLTCNISVHLSSFLVTIRSIYPFNDLADFLQSVQGVIILFLVFIGLGNSVGTRGDPGQESSGKITSLYGPGSFGRGSYEFVL